MIPSKIKSLIEEYCMGLEPNKAQQDEIIKAVKAAGLDAASRSEVNAYMFELMAGPTKEQKLAAEAEAKRKAEEDARRKAKEEAERKAKAEAEEKAKAEKAKREAETKAKAEAERKIKEEAERKAKTIADKKAKEDAERKAKEEAVKRAIKDAEEKKKAKQRFWFLFTIGIIVVGILVILFCYYFWQTLAIVVGIVTLILLIKYWGEISGFERFCLIMGIIIGCPILWLMGDSNEFDETESADTDSIVVVMNEASTIAFDETMENTDKSFYIRNNALILTNNGSSYLSDMEKKTIPNAFTKIVFPSCYTQIYYDDFRYCKKGLGMVTTLDFSRANNISKISDDAFTGAKKLAAVVLPKKVEYICEFKECPLLKEIHIYEMKTNYKITGDADHRLVIFASNVTHSMTSFSNEFLDDVKILYVPQKSLRYMKEIRDKYNDQLDIRPLPEGYKFPDHAISQPIY